MRPATASTSIWHAIPAPRSSSKRPTSVIVLSTCAEILLSTIQKTKLRWETTSSPGKRPAGSRPSPRAEVMMVETVAPASRAATASLTTSGLTDPPVRSLTRCDVAASVGSISAAVEPRAATKLTSARASTQSALAANPSVSPVERRDEPTDRPPLQDAQHSQHQSQTQTERDPVAHLQRKHVALRFGHGKRRVSHHYTSSLGSHGNKSPL